ncbi:MAG: FecR domain-containing protein [Caulobacterales bacterium]|nr:FecR domain-containing protein [Caulobacterales bacterium]
MSHGPDIAADPTIRAEASAWIAQLETGDLSREDRAALEEWVRRSPQHAAALKSYAAIWEQLDSLAMLQAPLEAALSERRASRRAFARPRLARVLGGAVAAALIAALASVAILAAQSYLVDRRNPAFAVATGFGQARSVTLPDGSIVDVNTSSEVEIAYSSEERRVRLLAGEALFTVEGDRRRPFVVYAGPQRIRAVGTRFAVRLEKGEVAVSVAEGRVELETRANPAPRDPAPAPVAVSRATPNAVLVEGQSAAASPDGVGPIEVLGPHAISRRLSWRDGVLDFSGETLEYAVGEIVRYTPLSIEIADARLRDLEVGGVFQVGETDHLFAVLEDNFDVRVEHVGERAVRLSMRD